MESSLKKSGLVIVSVPGLNCCIFVQRPTQVWPTQCAGDVTMSHTAHPEVGPPSYMRENKETEQMVLTEGGNA